MAGHAVVTLEQLELTEIEAEAYGQLFDVVDRDKTGNVLPTHAADLLKTSMLPAPVLSKVRGTAKRERRSA